MLLPYALLVSALPLAWEAQLALEAFPDATAILDACVVDTNPLTVRALLQGESTPRARSRPWRSSTWRDADDDPLLDCQR